MNNASQQIENERLKSQVLRVGEAVKNVVDETTKLVWHWLDFQRGTANNFVSEKDEKQSNSKLMTVEEIANFLQVDSRIIRNKTKCGDIPAYEVGDPESLSKDFRYNPAEVLNALKTKPLQMTEAMQQQTKNSKYKK